MKTLGFTLTALLLSACAIQEGGYQETRTVSFNDGTGSSITETTAGSYRGTAPLAGAAIISTPHVTAGITQPAPAYYPPPRPSHYPPPYYGYPAGEIRTYSNGNTTISRGTGLIYGGCTRTIRRGSQITQVPVPCR